MKRSGLFWLVAGVFALALVAAPLGVAAAPSNDDLGSATEVTTLPFNDARDISEATTEPLEPLWYGQSRTVWYRIEPSTGATLRLVPTGDYSWDTLLFVYRADGPGMTGLSWVANGYSGGSLVFDAKQGSTYYVQAASLYGYGTGFSLHIESVPPPENDDFANAVAVSELPLADNVDLTGATIQAGEPTSNCGGDFIKSLWYTFKPATTATYSASVFGIQGGVNVYTGSSFSEMTRVACGSSGTGMGTFHGVAGTTYYLQSGTWTGGGFLETRLDVTPPPAMGFIWGPSYPSSYDTLTFYNTSFDPGGIGLQSWSWNFGDGSTSTEPSPQHQFPKDGEYNVTITGTTYDGRTNSATQVVRIETHDVSISWMSVTGRGRVGRASPIQVGIGNTRYAENVQVDFYKSVPGGYQLIGTLTNSVPVMKKPKTALFSLDYTFTNSDLAIGKVTFQAVVTIVGQRPAIDAFPADNTATSLGTVVTK